MPNETNLKLTVQGLMERRSRQRFQLELQCFLGGPGKRGHVPIGKTVDISRTGILVAWDRYQSAAVVPNLGATLRVDVELPPNRFGRRFLRCRGRVVRVQMAQGQHACVAVAIRQIEFGTDSRKPVAAETSLGAIEGLLM